MASRTPFGKAGFAAGGASAGTVHALWRQRAPTQCAAKDLLASSIESGSSEQKANAAARKFAAVDFNGQT